MRFHWLGEWAMIYFEWPQRQLGTILLVLYALLFLALYLRIARNYYRRRREFAGTWGKRIFSLIGWILLAVAFANTLKLQWTAPSLPIGLDQNRTPILFLSYIPIALAALQFGAGPAMLVGMVVGWMTAAFGNGRLPLIFEVGAFGLVAAMLLYQDFRGRVGWIARQPLFAVPSAGVTLSVLSVLSNLAYSDPRLSAMSAFIASIEVAAANLPVYLIQSLVAGAVLQAIYALWPHLRAVQDPTRVAPYERSISMRFLYAFLPTAVLIVIVVLLAVMSQASHVALTQAIDEIGHVAGNVSLELPYFQWTGQPFLSGLALDDDLQSTDYDEREASLQRGMQTLPFFTQIALIDQDDPERIPRNIFPPPDKQHQLTAVEQMLLELTLRDGSPQISRAHRDEDGAPIISFLVPVHNALAPQELEGALIGRVHIETNYQLQSMIGNLQPPGDAARSAGVGFLINDADQIVAHPDPARILDTWTPNPEPSVEHDPPAIRTVEPSDQVDRQGLARARAAEQAGNARLVLEGHVEIEGAPLERHIDADHEKAMPVMSLA